MTNLRRWIALIEAKRPRDRWVPWLQGGNASNVGAEARKHFKNPEDVKAVMLIWNAIGGYQAPDFDDVMRKAIAYGPESYGTSTEAIQRVAGQLYDPSIPDIPSPMDNPTFRQWFGKSKVVDPEGEPLIVFHGTTSEIKSFSKANLGSNTGAKSALGGFFFTSSSGNAGEYAGGSASKNNYNDYHSASHLTNAKSGPNILPVYLSLQRPLIHDMQRSEYRDVSFDDLIKQAKRNKRDGVIIHKTYDPLLSDVFIAFKPEQIRSAFG